MPSGSTVERLIGRTTRGIAALVALALCMCAANGALLAQDSIQFNWRAQTFERLTRVPAERAVRITISSINSVCYDYEITVNQIAAVERSQDFLALLGAKDPTKAAPAADSGGNKAGQSPMGTPGLLPVSRVPASRDFDAIGDAVAAAYSDIAAAQATIDSLVDLRNKAKAALAKFYSEMCPGGTNRGPDMAAVPWDPVKKDLADFVTSAKSSLTVANGRLKSATAIVALATQLLAAFDINVAKDTAYQAFASSVAGKIAEKRVALKGAPDELKKQADAGEQLAADAKVFGGAIDGISGALTRKTIIRNVYVLDNTESISIAVKATGKSGIASVKDAKLEDAVSVPVKRRNRVFVTAGFLFSSLEEHDFQRMTRFKSDGTTYSTLIDRKNNSRLAFAPALLTHMTIVSHDNYDLLLTGGAAARSVGGQTSPDFLAGVSLGIRDRVALTIGLHMGRVETLLVGDAETVSNAAVPDVITRDGAVGTTWVRAFAFAFTVRLP